MSPQVPLKIVRIIARLNVGGPARQACLLHERLRPEFETVLISGRPDKGEEDMSYLLDSHEGVHWIDSMSRPVRFFSDLRSLVSIYRILRREKPDIVHTHTAKAGALGRIAAILAGVPVRVHTFHGHVFAGYFRRFKTRTYLGIERLLARFTTRIVTVSEGQAAELADVYRVAPRSNIQVMRNGFEWSASPGSRAEVERNESRSKTRQRPLDGPHGTHQGNRIAGRCGQAGSAVGLTDVRCRGDGLLRPEFEANTRGCGNLRMVGWQRDIAPLLKACDVVLLTSINEGTPTALIEAMFAAKPFVATDAGGTSELAVELQLPVAGIQNAKNGFIVQRDARALVECLKNFATNAVLRLHNGRARPGTRGEELGQRETAKGNHTTL